MSDIAIRVEGLGKQYRIGKVARYNTLRDQITEGITAPFRKLGSLLRGTESSSSDSELFWALHDVSFEVPRGSVLGVIGRNGAGKSTLLKVLSRITEPTVGRAEIHGRVGSLLEVGTGFHPELTGRDNIFLNGAILGMKKAEIARKFDEIVAFAEIEKFIDTAVKHYSSGMYMRLAFAVAAHLEPEILIVDEVLAVGDAAFQKKCLGKMDDVAKLGKTVLFVSHNMPAVLALCGSVLLLNNGKKQLHTSNVHAALGAYAGTSVRETWRNARSDDPKDLQISQVDISLSGEQPELILNVTVEFASFSQHKPCFVAFDIIDSTGAALMQALPIASAWIQPATASQQIRAEILLPPLIPGNYRLGVWIGPHFAETYDELQSVLEFSVETGPDTSRTFPHTRDHGAIVPRSRIVAHRCSNHELTFSTRS
ncbi:MAG: polysaccharide ABC transporter ATP-binding protein [Bryobacteraceae bacterium]